MTDENAGKPSVVDFFEKGKNFMEELLKENEALRMKIAKLETDKRDLSSQATSSDSPLIQRKVEVLEKEVARLDDENQELRDQFAYVETENQEFAERYVQVERQNSDLISLYVASYQLHTTLDYEEVVSSVKEIVINLVGAEEFGIYMVDETRNQLQLITQEKLEGKLDSTLPIDETPIGITAETGEVFVEDLPEGIKRSESGGPIACIPLTIGEQITGVIVIYSLLVQKAGFESLDFELFQLLGNHAATAIYAARLYTLSERKRITLQGFLDILKSGTNEP